LPEIATAAPKMSPAAAAGLKNVFRSAPVVMSNRYAAPAFVAPVSSPSAPMTIRLPSMPIERPKSSWTPGDGLTIFRTSAPVTASYTKTAPESVAPVSSKYAPTATYFPPAATA
jgi:hypothetical protein